MGTIIKKGQKYYVRVYYNGRPREIAAKTGDRKVAELLLRRLETEKRRDPMPRAVTRTELATMVEQFALHLKDTQRNASYRRDLSLLRRVFGGVSPCLAVSAYAGKRSEETLPPTDLAVKYIEQLTPDMIVRHLDREARTLAGRGVNGLRQILHRLCAYAIRHQAVRFPGPDLETNPVARIPKWKESTPPIRYLPSGEAIDAQLEALDHEPSLRMAAALMILAGLRREEATWVQVSDIDRKRMSLMVCAKTDKRTGETWQPKTGHNRQVPISPTLMKEIDRHIERVRPQSWLVQTKRGLRYLPDNMASDIRDINREHRLHWTCLDYRHTFGSHLVQMGYSTYEVAEWMGNSPAIVRKHYGNLDGRFRRTDIDFAAMHRSQQTRRKKSA